jgi:hypothetical protein
MGSVMNSLGTLSAPAVGLGGVPGAGFGWYEVLANTFWQPINLSWNLGGGWFIAGAFSFTGPDGSRWTGTPNPDYWTFEPALAISYLGSSWVLSANFFYDINTQSNGRAVSQVLGSRSRAATPSMAISQLSTRSASGNSARWRISKHRRRRILARGAPRWVAPSAAG